MFESALYQVFVTDQELISYLNTHKGIPAVFDRKGPKNIDFNYLIFRIHGSGDPTEPTVDTFTISVDFFGYERSGKTARAAMKRVVELLDLKHLKDEYYDTIRIWRDGVDEIENTDPRAQQYNARFKARAARSGWMEKTIT